MDSDITIRGLSGALGAEIRGLDLSRPLSGNESEILLDAFAVGNLTHGKRRVELASSRRVEVGGLWQVRLPSLGDP